jgi:hypothetical protein
MIKLVLFFLFVGALASWRSKTAIRAYNRRMFPSMQEKTPTYLRPFILFTLLGLALAAVVRFIPITP